MGIKLSEVSFAYYVPKKISEPILDRIDMMIEVFPVEYKKIRNRGQEETSSEMRKKIREARMIQKERFLNTGILLNAEMNQKQTECFCILQKEAEEVLHSLFETNEFSTRRYYRILK